MKSSRRGRCLVLAIALLICAVATTSASQTETTAPTSASPHTKQQLKAASGRRHRSAYKRNASGKKTRRVPHAKSLSKESY